jgi:hypothetical protein
MLNHRALLTSSALVFSSILVACWGEGGGYAASASGPSGSTSTGTGGSAGTAGTGAGSFMPGPHGAAPQVINFGGTVLASPKLQIISYASDPMAKDVDAFAQELTMASASAWAAQTQEYGVGALSVLPTISLTGTPPAMMPDDTTITTSGATALQDYIASQTSGANPAWGAADPSTVYMFLLPSGTDIDASGHCCSDFLGYHDEAPVGNGSVPYGIVCNCGAVKGDPLTPLDWVTTTVIHETVESSTDPFPNTNSAFGWVDNDHVLWAIATGGEVSDMCDDNADSNFTPQGSTYMIQRSWSDAAAKAGRNPCVPYPTTDPYFNSIPVLPDSVTINVYGQNQPTQGVSIPVGGTGIVEVQLYSEAQTSGPWTVTAWDYNYYNGTGPTDVDVRFMETGKATATGSNGDTLHLEVKVNQYDSNLGGAGFVLESDLGQQDNLWFAFIGQ